VDLAYWDSIKNEKSVSYYQSYLSRFPNGTFADLARLRIVEFSTSEIGGDGQAENRRTASIQPGQVTGGPSCSQGQKLDNQGRCNPIASGLTVFDGYWTHTRIAKSAKVCLWKQLTDSVTIANGLIHSNNFSGTVYESGKVEITLTFTYNGNQGFNRFTGKITNGKGTGQYYSPNRLDGGCKGMFVLSR
jgi:hypothetical protein